MANLVRVKDKFQITIPVAMRQAVSVQAGDYLEISAVDGGILLRPQHASSAVKPSILDFLNETRAQTRSRAQIDHQVSIDRAQWA